MKRFLALLILATPLHAEIPEAAALTRLAVSPDGRHVVCSRTSGGRKGLVLVDTWYGRLIPLAKYTGDDTLPAYSGN